MRIYLLVNKDETEAIYFSSEDQSTVEMIFREDGFIIKEIASLDYDLTGWPSDRYLIQE